MLDTDHKVASATGGLPCELSPEQFALARDKGTNKYKSLLKVRTSDCACCLLTYSNDAGWVTVQHVKPDRDVDQAVKESSLIVQSRASLQPGKSAAPTKAPQTIPLTAATMHSDDHVGTHHVLGYLESNACNNSTEVTLPRGPTLQMVMWRSLIY